MKLLISILLLCTCYMANGQRGFAFNRISTEDGIGLASNDVRCIYQDARGFIWVGTANGLQRFDGNKFIHFSSGGDPMPHTAVTQIYPVSNGKLFIGFTPSREFGIFDPVSFTYKKIPLATGKEIGPASSFYPWQDDNGDVYINVWRHGMLRYDVKSGTINDDAHIVFPPGWKSGLRTVFVDTAGKQVWFATDSGLCIYDKASRAVWNETVHPAGKQVLHALMAQKGVVQIFIDKKRRHWILKWSEQGQQLVCTDAEGNTCAAADTAGFGDRPGGYVEMHNFFETKRGGLWIYGSGVLFSYDNEQRRFNFIGSDADITQTGITYETVNQVMDDRDGSTWIVTNRGIYFTSAITGSFSVVNILFDNRKNPTEITDILELPDNDFWLASWGHGVRTLDKYLHKKENYLFNTPPPAAWSASLKGNTKLTWALSRESSTGKIWIGCNGGVIMLHDPANRSTAYFNPEVFKGSTTRYIAEDSKGITWFGTQGGSVIKFDNGQFIEWHHFNTSVYKIFFDNRGMMWVSVHENGLYALDPGDGKVLYHFTANAKQNALFTNGGSDIEQLNDSIIVFAAGALNFINKYTGTVRQLSYEEGLPSNSVTRLRMDQNGFLWIITANGLCRYNPSNNRITSFGRKDGIVLAEKTNMADYRCSSGYMVFGGSNAMIMFHPSVYSNTQPPPDVTITDFKIFNQYYPVDSLLQQQKIKLLNDQNSISIYFASLSFMQRDKLTYYYKMEGLDEDWIKADKSLFVNYSQMPSGNYVFKVYCENLEGIRSEKVTEMRLYIKPPFWRTGWFLSVCLFIVALIIYVLHSMRVNKLLAVEKLRNNVARDLHDDMGSTLSTINILSSMAKSKIGSDPVKANEYISKITDNSQRMMEAMDDIVWSIKPSNDSMQRIIARMREFATNVLEPKDTELNFFADESLFDVKLNMQARRDLFLIFKEAVNNAAKYSQAGTVTISIRPDDKKLLLLIKDNGIGFDISKADGNGLGNMQKRAESLMGKITIDSGAGNGTTIKLLIPLT